MTPRWLRPYQALSVYIGAVDLLNPGRNIQILTPSLLYLASKLTLASAHTREVSTATPFRFRPWLSSFLPTLSSSSSCFSSQVKAGFPSRAKVLCARDPSHHVAAMTRLTDTRMLRISSQSVGHIMCSRGHEIINLGLDQGQVLVWYGVRKDSDCHTLVQLIAFHLYSGKYCIAQANFGHLHHIKYRPSLCNIFFPVTLIQT